MEPFIELTEKWRQFGQGDLTLKPYDLAIPVVDRELLERLYQTYPRLDRAEILRDLLSAALRDMEQSLPYEKGSRVIATDEWGDEIYEDSGLTPRFLSLSKEFQSKLKHDLTQQNTSKGENTAAK
ncbi:pilin assembly protein [Pseudomaricurvus hydrocarbonicus]|uniref:pilin assembly protein n=1 Tax=Pseudomaricurvus hydrocarbonicus TaxID=1470433 RepID=UPI001AA07004|nr:pilin assembly protein [Aestuariicella hydrocarbonica]